MKIIISPAKKMNVDTDTLPVAGEPCFLNETSQLLAYLKGLTYGQAKELWKCNDKLAELNFERVQHMDLKRQLTPAIISYEGIQYQYMAPDVLEEEALAYIQEHLRILSGFYGVLKPFDGVTPYRLEMQAKAAVHGCKDLYDFWGSKLYEKVAESTDCILNLASKEYSKCVEKNLEPGIRYVTVIFGQIQKGKVVQKGTLVKMARGEMVRYMAQHQIENVEQIKEFAGLDFRFCEEKSDKKTFVFLQ